MDFFLLTFTLLFLTDSVSTSQIECYFYKKQIDSLNITGIADVDKQTKNCSTRCVSFIVDVLPNFYLFGTGCDDDFSKTPIAIDEFLTVWKEQMKSDPKKTYWYDKWYAAGVCDEKPFCNDRSLLDGLVGFYFFDTL